MSEPEATGLALVANAVMSTPEPVKASFLAAADNLIGGLTAIPAAWLKRHAQAIEDTTAARSAVAARLAQVVADAAVNDPIIVQTAAEFYLPVQVRRAANLVKIVHSAAEHVADTATENAQPAPPDDDWMNRFMRFAEDASSERLQELFARILAGEVVRPGSFGAATLRAVSELDQSIANDFSSAWARSVGDSVDYAPELHRGADFSRWKRLSEAGLMAPSQVKQYLPPINPAFNGVGLWSPMSAGGVILNIAFKEGSNTHWVHVEFTRAGRELGSLLPSPNYEANIRDAARRLPTHGVISIELWTTGKPPEVIWRTGK